MYSIDKTIDYNNYKSLTGKQIPIFTKNLEDFNDDTIINLSRDIVIKWISCGVNCSHTNLFHFSWDEIGYKIVATDENSKIEIFDNIKISDLVPNIENFTVTKNLIKTK